MSRSGFRLKVQFAGKTLDLHGDLLRRANRAVRDGKRQHDLSIIGRADESYVCRISVLENDRGALRLAPRVGDRQSVLVVSDRR